LSRFYSYINSATAIIQQYNGTEPLAAFLKKYFTVNKKYGSKDRKQISHLIYCYFRLGKASVNDDMQERLLTALFLGSHQSQAILEALRPEWNEQVSAATGDKLALLSSPIDLTTIFPWHSLLSEGVEAAQFSAAHLQQPYLFIRIRPGYFKTVTSVLQQQEVPFTIISETCLALPNGTKIEEIVSLNKTAVVQDYSSQQVAGLFAYLPERSPLKVWDCCAASGGKSIMLWDNFMQLQLTVSDIRASILTNLRNRFEQAGIKNFTSFIANASEPVPQIKPNTLDLVIADVPCSGSGTWSRTPEQLYFFETAKITAFQQLQQQIVQQTCKAVKPGGYYLYITCSVFKDENEAQVTLLQEQGFTLVEQKLFKGYEQQADTMFAALLKKN
jgi:16S rRNA (cytosine967-C5)-methyltransferase